MYHHGKSFAAATIFILLFVGAYLWPLSSEPATLPDSVGQSADQLSKQSRVSPAQRIKRESREPHTDHNVPRPLDGFGNNRRDPQMNAANSPLKRLLTNDYADGFSTMAGPARPSPRIISNLVFAQAEERPNRVGATDFVWQWGQFLDHDIDLSEGVDPPENAPIGVPAGDPWFSNGLAMDFNRSIYASDDKGVRQQLNEITGWIDASNVYGSDDERSVALRTMDGTGRLKTSAGNLLPNNVDGLSNAGGDSAQLFLAGDVRANEQAALTAMHTLFVREHNRLAGILRAEAESSRGINDDARGENKLYRYRDSSGDWAYSDRPPAGQSDAVSEIKPTGQSRRHENPNLSGDEIFERARALVAAEMQHITYTEFLPVLLGAHAIPGYQGYRSSTDARIMNEFSTAAFRLGHSMLSPTLLRLDENGETIAAGNLPLRLGFFAPDQIRLYGIEPLLRGLARQECQDVDSFVIDDVRNFLFGAPGQGGFDLVSLNIQRGRDHGLPGYNAARIEMGLTPAVNFSDISSDPEVRDRLQQAYASVEEVDMWVGGMAEDKYQSGMVGELFHTIVRQQFVALRDGDRFWYRTVLNKRDQARIEKLSLADIIRLNTNIEDEIQDNVFILSNADTRQRRRR